MPSKNRKEADKRYRLKHAKRIKESKKLDYENNKENILERNKQHYSNNRESLIQYKKEYRIKKYGISLKEYDEMFDKQNGRCAICGKHQDEFKKRLFIDHCHKTKKIRGLLCDKCNRGIGFFNDDVETIRKALIYLLVDIE